MRGPSDVSTWRLVVVPGGITLAVTLLRLVGELAHWSPALFGRDAGGGGALIGIAWLVPIFGLVFAAKLASAGQGPARKARAIALNVAAFALLPVLGVLATLAGLPQQSLTVFAIYVVGAIGGSAVAFQAWPALARVLFAYGVTARVPVVLVMLVAMLGNWGTHYDAPPPGLPEMTVVAKWFLIGVVPQLTIWIWYTIAVGGIFGSVLAAVRRPRSA